MVVNSTVSKNSVMTTVPGQPTGGEALGGGLSSEAGTLVVKRSVACQRDGTSGLP
jgi:hypothetical protein